MHEIMTLVVWKILASDIQWDSRMIGRWFRFAVVLFRAPRARAAVGGDGTWTASFWHCQNNVSVTVRRYKMWLLTPFFFFFWLFVLGMSVFSSHCRLCLTAHLSPDKRSLLAVIYAIEKSLKWAGHLLCTCHIPHCLLFMPCLAMHSTLSQRG